MHSCALKTGTLALQRRGKGLPGRGGVAIYLLHWVMDKLFFVQYLVVHCCRLGASLLSSGAPRSHELLWLECLACLLTYGPHSVGPVDVVGQFGVALSVTSRLECVLPTIVSAV